MKKIDNGGGVSGDDGLPLQLTVSVQHRHGDGVAVDIEADILDAIHRVFLSSGLVYCSAQQPNPTSKGAPFYNACPTQAAFAWVGWLKCRTRLSILLVLACDLARPTEALAGYPASRMLRKYSYPPCTFVILTKLSDAVP